MFPAGYLAALVAGAPGQLAVAAHADGLLVGLGSAADVAPGTREIGLLVEDAWQHRGVGRQLLTALVNACTAAGTDRLRAEVLDEDAGLVNVLRRLGPTATRPSHGVLSVTVSLWA
jgi:GNAT superfamily N-acetyltransferase